MNHYQQAIVVMTGPAVAQVLRNVKHFVKDYQGEKLPLAPLPDASPAGRRMVSVQHPPPEAAVMLLMSMGGQ